MLVPSHIYAASAKSYAFSLQPQTLFKG